MAYTKDFSIIIPVWRGAAKSLPMLFSTIPNDEKIEVIVVDNSQEPLQREEIATNRDFVFLHSSPERHAGGSRNDGMSVAQGRWLLFADADDYFAEDAFDTYYSMVDTGAEIVFTSMGGIYTDTGERSDRGDAYAQLVHRYCMGQAHENLLRLRFASPCCKMVSHALVDRHQLRYDEIRAGNDNFFSITSGYYAQKIAAVDKITYIATVNHGSLTQRRDCEVIKARLYSKLHCNQFLKEHGLSEFQYSIMFALAEARHYGLSTFLEFVRMIMLYHQNPFVGWRRWLKSMKVMKKNDQRNKDYIVH